MPLFPDSIVMVPHGTTRDEVEARVLAAIRDSSTDKMIVGVCEENFQKTVKPYASRAMVTRLATHWVRVFEEV